LTLNEVFGLLVRRALCKGNAERNFVSSSNSMGTGIVLKKQKAEPSRYFFGNHLQAAYISIILRKWTQNYLAG
jgi:hypothetical protein